MTVPYTSSANYWASIRLLLRWRGSIWKSVLPEFTMWIVIYYTIFITFIIGYFKTSEIFAERYKVNTTTHIGKNGTILHDYWIISLCRSYDSDYSIPLVMLLSFYSSKAFERWQYIFNNIAYAENLALTVNAFIKGSDRIAQLARQTVMRQAILAQILVYRDISISVRKRFPTLECLIDAEYLKPDELKMLKSSFNPYNVFSIPFCWIGTLLTKLRQDGNITGEPTYVNLFTEIKEFRKKLEIVYNYDCVPIPLAYPQIVSLAVRMHIIVNIFGKLFTFSKTEGIWMLNKNFGLVSGPEIFVFLAWLKVAEILANPLGEDDDDLELNHIIDRNTYISRSIIETHDQCPLLEDTEMNPNPKYDEHAKGLGGPRHRLEGSAVGSKVDVGCMVEVEPTKKSEITKRVKWQQKKRMSDMEAFADQGEKMGTSYNIPSEVFCVEVPSLYDKRNLRSLTDEEISERFGDKSRVATSLLDMSDPSPLSARRLAKSSKAIFDENACRF